MCSDELVHGAACAGVDLRSTRAADGAVTRLRVNIGLSVLTGVALAVALAVGIPAALRVWGVWDVTAGITQLVSALRLKPADRDD
ncbi:hypothetical protein [Streptomyces sp. NPDC057336]|uniref:hypothetical protein n=1 Tax=Streptomyces sp. NPDC057336 TaxID=3346102 RepID=UPI0036339B6F